MRMGGFNIHPSKIEEYIKTFSGVVDCAVIGMPDPEEQTVPVAFIVINASVDIEELTQTFIDNSKNDLSEMEIPVKWIFVDSLPRNTGGKVDKNAMKKMAKEM